MKKRLVAAAIVVLVLLSMLPGTMAGANAASSSSQVTRYTVLVLDTTGQYTITPGYYDYDTVTVGSPLENVKQAAYRFVEEVLAAEGANYVALVTCTYTASLVSDFSNDVTALKNAISSIPEENSDSASGFSNFNEALTLASSLLEDKESAFAIRNILFFSGCLPAAGDYTENGHYSGSEFEYYQGFYVMATGINVYQHANVVYNTAERLKAEGYNIYTLSCFTNLDQQQESFMFAQQVMIDIQNKGFFDAVNPEDIVIEIGEAAKEIVKPDIKEYYRVIRINCPVDVEVYDSVGTFFGSIIDNVVNAPPGSDILLSYDENDEKTIFLPVYSSFNIRLIGTAAGEMTYTVTEYNREQGGTTRIVNFFDLPLRRGVEYSASLDEVKDGEKTEYILEGPDGEIAPDDDFAKDEIPVYTASVAVDGNGAAAGGGSFYKGEFTQLSASPSTGEEFIGWFRNDTLLSSELTHKVCVRADASYTAKFTDSRVRPSPAPVSPSPRPSTSPVFGLDSGANTQGNGAQVVLIFIVIAVVAIFTVVLVVTSKNRAKASPDHYAPVEAMPYESGVYQPPAAGGGAGMDMYQQPADADVFVNPGAVTVLTGSKSGATVTIKSGSSITLGKNLLCYLAFPDDYIHVSRSHCTISYDGQSNMYSVTDTSSNGTFSGNYQLPKGQPFPVLPGTTLKLANDSCSVLLE